MKSPTMTFFACIMLALLILPLSGCSAAIPKIIDTPTPTATGPEEVYNQFRDACDKQDIATAESLATTAAIAEKKKYTVCMTLLPDGMNLMTGSELVKIKGQKPEVKVSGNTAYLSWWNNGSKQDFEYRLTMFKEGNSWKLREMLRYDPPQ